MRWQPDGVLLSNGPGNPLDLPEVITAVQQLLGKVPLCGNRLRSSIVCASLWCTSGENDQSVIGEAITRLKISNQQNI